MTPAGLARKIQERLTGVGCQPSDKQLSQMVRYCQLLSQWNPKINLTALPLDGFPERTLDVLIAEPIVLIGFIENKPLTWFDFGSGAGSPAFPIKIMVPEAALTLVESRQRKGAFLRETIRTLELDQATVRTIRIEEIREESTAQLVTLRAVRLSPEIGEAARRVLQPGGRLAAFGTAAEPVTDGFGLERSVQLPTEGHMLHLLVRSD